MHRRVCGLERGGGFFGWYVLYFSLFFFILFYRYRNLWGVFFWEGGLGIGRYINLT